MRARDLGIVIGTLEPGEHDAITDVPGVRVGHTTVIEGDDVRTGVTVVVPHEGHVWSDPVYAAYHRLNGNGEMTGLPWLEEVGLLHSPIGITNTHSVGVVRDALVEHRGRVGCRGLGSSGRGRDLGRHAQRRQRLPRHRRAREGGVRGRRPTVPSPRVPWAAAPGWCATTSRAGSVRRRARRAG